MIQFTIHSPLFLCTVSFKTQILLLPIVGALMEPRKRSRTTAELQHSELSPKRSSYSGMSGYSSPSPSPLDSIYNTPSLRGGGEGTGTHDFLISEISDLKAELERLTSLRRLDQIKADNTESRLKRHIVSLEEDAKESHLLAEQIRIQSEEALERMSEARKKAEKHARDWERRYMRLKDGTTEEGTTTPPSSSREEILQGEVDLLRRQNSNMKTSLEATRKEVASLRNKLESTSSTPQSLEDDSSKEEYDINLDSTPTGKKRNKRDLTMSPAPPAVLTELNRTRVKLADSERQNRQLGRKVDELQIVANQAIHYREKSKRAESKVKTLEQELQNVMREREHMRIVEGRWVQFRKELVQHSIGSHQMTLQAGGDENTPPEIATAIRFFRDLQEQTTNLKDENHKKQIENQSFSRRIKTLEALHEEQQLQTNKLSADLIEIRENLNQTEMELLSAHSREDIWKRERDHLRSLLETYKKTENGIAMNEKKVSDQIVKQERIKGDPSIEGLKLALISANEDNDIIKSQLEELKSQKGTTESEYKSLKEEHAKVVEKFGKLRDALYQEREKAAKAEDRAFKAETMVGKGSFNPDSTRALHLQNNPYAQAIREKHQKEVIKLRTLIEEKEIELAERDSCKSTISGVAVPPLSSRKQQDGNLDAQKLNKRLKESFREQIGLFREGVYLITGYKIDMLSDTTDGPRFKVRSMFAEHEEDHLMFIWPKVEEGASPTSLDILNTKMAQLLSEDPAFEYMKKFNSVPAFMASVSLSLFERQTMV